MNAKQIGLSLVLLAFGGVEAYGVWQVGYVGVFEQALGSVGATLGFVDLCVALGLVTVWLVQDARDRGISPVPYMLLTLGLGSVGPLLYLIRREGRESAGVLNVARAS
jgi:hypothetical protein